MKVRFFFNTGFAGRCHEEVRDYPDDETDANIEQDFNDWLQMYSDWGWHKIEGAE